MKLGALLSLVVMAAPLPLQALPLTVGIPRDTSPCAFWREGLASGTAVDHWRAVDDSLRGRGVVLSASQDEPVAVLRGSAADEWLMDERNRGVAAVEPRRFDSMQEITAALQREDPDRALIDQRAARELLQSEDWNDLRILSDYPLRFYQAFAVSPGLERAILERINIAITQIGPIEHYEW